MYRNVPGETAAKALGLNARMKAAEPTPTYQRSCRPSKMGICQGPFSALVARPLSANQRPCCRQTLHRLGVEAGGLARASLFFLISALSRLSHVLRGTEPSFLDVRSRGWGRWGDLPCFAERLFGRDSTTRAAHQSPVVHGERMCVWGRDLCRHAALTHALVILNNCSPHRQQPGPCLSHTCTLHTLPSVL